MIFNKHLSISPKTINNSGFTLIEVMVALTIIAIALGSLIKASGNHTNSASYLKSKTLAHYVALNEITQFQIEQKWPDLGSKHGSTEMAGVEWYWSTKIKKSDIGETIDATGNIRTLAITVYQDEDRTRNLAHLNAYIFNPASLAPPVRP